VSQPPPPAWDGTRANASTPPALARRLAQHAQALPISIPICVTRFSSNVDPRAIFSISCASATTAGLMQSFQRASRRMRDGRVIEELRANYNPGVTRFRRREGNRFHFVKWCSASKSAPQARNCESPARQALAAPATPPKSLPDNWTLSPSAIAPAGFAPLVRAGMKRAQHLAGQHHTFYEKPRRIHPGAAGPRSSIAHRAPSIVESSERTPFPVERWHNTSGTAFRIDTLGTNFRHLPSKSANPST